MAFNNGPRLVTTGLNLLVDAGDPTSYPGSGTTWRDVIGGQNGTITGSVSYSSAYYGGLVFSGPTASVIFPTSSANFGTGSFTVEIAFQPARIEGIHYLISKNSGSYPNWGVYLSGSGGSGKLFSFFNINSTVSCSISSSSTFVTGSNYDVSVKIAPGLSGSGISIDGLSNSSGLANGGGSLTSTGSLLIGNISPSSSQAYSGSIFANKIYSNTSFTQATQNYNAIASRLSKPFLGASSLVFELLVVAGGGGGANGFGGGAGAGGLQYVSSFTPTSGTTVVTVGVGGSQGGPTKGTNSTFGSYISFGGGTSAGGNAGSYATTANGGSGGGGGQGNGTPGTGSTGQGNSGGTAVGLSTAGGGGAGQSGRDYNDPISPSAGGSGSYIPSFAAIGGFPAGWFAGGGGGGVVPGLGGIGGGGTGGNSIGQTGSANTGGGGGGGGGGGSAGGNGGSGIVAIRYNGTPIAVGGEITQSAGYTYHVYRTVGTSSFTIF